MKKRMIEMICPNCRHSFYILKDTMLLYEGKGTDHERLMNSEYFFHQCQKCLNLFEMNYPLLIRFTRKNLCLILSDSSQLPDLDNQTVIRTRKPADFELIYQALDLGITIKELVEIREECSRQDIGLKQLIDVDGSKILALSTNGLIRINRVSSDLGKVDESDR